ncbi:MAG: amidophosphoribosyltransferase [Nitrososphaerota archaeon]
MVELGEAVGGMGMRERCGVIAVRSYGGRDVGRMLVEGLKSLQHRGQESWGVWSPEGFAFRRSGLVSHSLEVYLATVPNGIKSGIGHVRYSTVGGEGYIQPVEVGGKLALAHNGTIANYKQLAKSLGLRGPAAGSDSIVAGHLLIRLVEGSGGDWVAALARFSRMVSGSFCLAMALPDGTLMAARDPIGFRPLCIGIDESDDTYVVASESCALDALGARMLRDLRPGELVVLSDGGVENHRFSEPLGKGVCSFEYVYFAHPSSVIDGVSVYEVRKRLGRLMAGRLHAEADVVVPIPESARPAALGLSEASGIPMEEALVKDRYLQKGRMRGFVEPDHAVRAEVARWIVPVKRAIEGKRVVLVDDSVVRGVTARIVIESVRRAGARSVVLVSTFPPILHPCMMGMDFPDREELIAHRAAVAAAARGGTLLEEIAREIGADSVLFSTPEDVAKAIGKKESELCFSCVTGDYGAMMDLPLGIPRKEFKGV